METCDVAILRLTVMVFEVKLLRAKVARFEATSWRTAVDIFEAAVAILSNTATYIGGNGGDIRCGNIEGNGNGI